MTSFPAIISYLLPVLTSRTRVLLPPAEKRKGEHAATDAKTKLLAELTAARAELARLHAIAVQKCDAVREALSVAKTTSLSPDTHIGTKSGSTPPTVGQLTDFVKQCEAELAHVRTMLCLVKTCLTEALHMAPGMDQWAKSDPSPVFDGGKSTNWPD